MDETVSTGSFVLMRACRTTEDLGQNPFGRGVAHLAGQTPDHFHAPPTRCCAGRTKARQTIYEPRCEGSQGFHTGWVQVRAHIGINARAAIIRKCGGRLNCGLEVREIDYSFNKCRLDITNIRQHDQTMRRKSHLSQKLRYRFRSRSYYMRKVCLVDHKAFVDRRAPLIIDECQQFKACWYDWEKRVRPESALACYAKGKLCAFHSEARLCYSRF